MRQTERRGSFARWPFSFRPCRTPCCLTRGGLNVGHCLDTEDKKMKTHSGIVVHLLVVYYARMMLSDEDHSAQRERRKRELHSASSLEEVLRLTDSPDWKLWKCRLKLKHLPPSPNRELYRSSPAGLHRPTRFAAASYSWEIGQEITQEILQAIDEEWQRTQCVPRDTCVDVAKELGTNPGVFFKPPCVSVFRCNGCCNNEGVTCRNTSTTHVNKTLFMVIPFHNKPEPVLIKVANHTECNCMEPALIRRHARPHRRNGCSLVQRAAGLKDPRNLCASGLIWDCMVDQCIPYPSRNQEFSPSPRMPDCEIDVVRCDCVPRNITRPLHRCYLNASICASEDKHFDQVFCRCK
ncbi:hypothetical protein AAFF_G00237070 [Aldrovandia affinis]|uniref:Platelet-derived growth factor (PDGF) family profile domain-containing protein n=1 Tax=Aldrovandia affinis TaxID=143900 RepID=A0AAD7REB6_9TELE|nr:hypothetical protein AAFF_G00237070 [Aldrovandia affinis]